MRKWMAVMLAVLLMLSAAACGRKTDSSEADRTSTSETEGFQIDESEGDGINNSDNSTKKVQNSDINSGQEDAGMKLQVQVGGSTFTATLENNDAAEAFVEMLEEGPVRIEMGDYSGFEKVGSLGTSLPASNRQMTTQAGDIVLYNSSQIVIFYGSNSWNYTKLAEVDDLSGWQEALGNGDVPVTFSIE